MAVNDDGPGTGAGRPDGVGEAVHQPAGCPQCQPGPDHARGDSNGSGASAALGGRLTQALNESVKRFKEGAERAMVDSLRRWYRENYEGFRKVSPRRLADLGKAVGVHPAQPDRWYRNADDEDGTTFNYMNMSMLIIAFNNGDCPLEKYLLGPRDLTIAGYLAALTSGAGRSISREEFWCLYHLHDSLKDWIAATDKARTNRRPLESLAKAILRRAEQDLKRDIRGRVDRPGDARRDGDGPRRVKGADDLQGLVREVGEAWLRLCAGLGATGAAARAVLGRSGGAARD